jgi:hypothetical protein
MFLGEKLLPFRKHRTPLGKFNYANVSWRRWMAGVSERPDHKEFR